jgi:hypothetical protein
MIKIIINTTHLRFLYLIIFLCTTETLICFSRISISYKIIIFTCTIFTATNYYKQQKYHQSNKFNLYYSNVTKYMLINLTRDNDLKMPVLYINNLGLSHIIIHYQSNSHNKILLMDCSMLPINNFKNLRMLAKWQLKE